MTGSHFKEQMKENVYLVEIGQHHCQLALVRSNLLQHGSSNIVLFVQVTVVILESLKMVVPQYQMLQ